MMNDNKNNSHSKDSDLKSTESKNNEAIRNKTKATEKPVATQTK